MDQINGMLAQLKQKTGRTETIRRLAVAGNTVMSHLFCGLSPESIGVAPFTPLSLFGESYDAKQIGIEGCETVYVVPSIAGYVGGDIVAGSGGGTDAFLSTGRRWRERDTAAGYWYQRRDGAWKSGAYVCCATAQVRPLKVRRSPWVCRRLPEPSQKYGWRTENLLFHHQ